MEIKDFIKDALAQIVDGVHEANTALKEKGACVPTENVVGAEGYADGTPRKFGEPIKRYFKVDFDIAVEVSKSDIEKVEEKGSLEGGLKLQVALISKANFDLHGDMSDSNTQQNVQQNIHHIKFSLPLSLPSTQHE